MARDEIERGYIGRTNEEIKLIIESKTFQELTVEDILLYEMFAPQKRLEDNKYLDDRRDLR